MSQLNTSQRQKLRLIKEIVEQSLDRNTDHQVERIQRLSLQLTAEESLIVRPVEGREILLENVFFRDLLALVQSPEFQAFYGSHMNRSIDHKPAMICIELHQVLQKIYVSEYDVPMSAEMSALILKTIMREKALRKPLISLILSYLDGKTNKTDTYKSVKRILTTNRNLLLDA
jgi:hypothetical protein